MSAVERLAFVFRHASIRRKLGAVIAITCSAAILAAGTAMFGFQTYRLRATFERDIAALSAIVADNLAGPVAFGDTRAALEVLGSLKAKPQIEAACVRTRAGESLATTGVNPPDDAEFSREGIRFAGWRLVIIVPVRVGAEAVGTLGLRANFHPTFAASFRTFLLALGAICAGAFAIALAVGSSLQKLITQPVQRLSIAASRIGEQHDYSVRVEKLGDDELGLLTDTFNRMLERLQSVDAELRRANAALTQEIDERRRLQSQLLEASRLAGMAEVATGVLHNVGNVLTSVNVSAGLMREQLEGSRVTMLSRTADLIRANQANLGHFFTQDERGQRVPSFLANIAAEITSEHARLSDELVGLSRNIDHIKEIVALQQNYAKPCAVFEKLNPCELFDHAVAIHRTSLERHEIEIARSYPARPIIFDTDRHKVLQILTNMVSNAIHATKVNPAGGRLIHLSFRLEPEGNLALEVRDNGAGISAENLAQIFRQGFTTRSDGHGFGLHSGALIAQSLGGKLSADSAGAGLGATFTLRLPTRSPAGVIFAS